MTQDTPSSNEPWTYAKAGVDIDAGNEVVDRIKPLVKATARAGADADLGGFGGLFDLKAAGFKDPILVAANDGVGTKLKVAIECDDQSTVGIDLVAMCVNDLIVQGAEPLFFLDYLATGALAAEKVSEVIAGIATGCKMSGAALIGGETAEMPGMYAKDDYDLAGFCVGAAERGTLLPRDDISEGDILIGIASSGVHSNGYSLVRKLVEAHGFSYEDLAPFDADKSLGRALLEPTRIYVKSLLSTIHTTGAVKALAHITGGGLTENLPRVLPDSLSASIDLDTISPPPVFRWLSELGNIEVSEMLKTFNCGVGMVAVVGAKEADKVLECLQAEGERAFIIGKLIPRDEDGVVYSGSLML